ncbi:formate dehydrogenase accessory protein FdhE [Desulfoplanes sp.]
MFKDDTEKIVFQSIRETAKTIESEKPDLQEPLEVFAGLFEAFETAQTQLAPWDLSGLELDADRFAAGECVLDMIPLVDFASSVRPVSGIVFQALGKSFPVIGEQIEPLKKDDFIDDQKGLYASMRDLLEGDENVLCQTAEKLGVEPDLFGFVVSQLVAPFLRSQAKTFAETFDLSTWTQGFCPICGALPSIAYLKGEGGKRWLHCSSCGHDWRFRRQVCPACGDNAAKGLEYFYLDERMFERAYVCKECKKYLLTIDIREMALKPNMDLSPVGLIPLDIKAQEEGYAPLAPLPWNTFD